MRDSLINTSGFSETFSLGKYIGIPPFDRAPMPRDYKYLVVKVYVKLLGWKRKHLSFVGRVTLSNSIFQAILVYTMMTPTIPKVCINDIHKIQKSFIRIEEKQRRKIHLNKCGVS
ncbi:hypothetical protein KIW84_062628 [Lathyrus oleraceus]|uniref:Uncharacterized protein n=1 Tax=Pisum sativum TaxID=3888 RepID=A0A9D4W823_PEA|nr:hypothetical protein KIW84_062628 [Pisum sativum]